MCIYVYITPISVYVIGTVEPSPVDGQPSIRHTRVRGARVHGAEGRLGNGFQSQPHLGGHKKRLGRVQAARRVEKGEVINVILVYKYKRYVTQALRLVRKVRWLKY